jgi:ATP-binding cassette, subfamily B (MDR/TAP), member 8
MEFFDKKRQGEILTHVSQDISSICTAVRQVFTSGLRSILTIVIGAGSMIMVSPKLAGGVFLVLPTMAGAGHLLGMGLQSLAKATNRANGLATSVVGEAVTNIRTVKAFVSEDDEVEKFSRALNKAVNLKVRMGVAAGAFFGALHLGINGMQLFLCLIGSQLISSNMIDAGSMVTATSQVMQLQRAFVSLSRTMTGLVRAMATCDGVYEVVLKEPTIEHKLARGNDKYPSAAPIEKVDTDVGGILFSNVDFYYPTRLKHQVLNSFNLKINQGNVVALVGSSGCGKSTVGNLLERFYDPTNGSVHINGVNIKNLSPSHLRKEIGLVDQQPKLFATSVLENIRYGRPNATDEEVIEAAELANAHEFVNGFPDRYQTNLGEHGSQLSGGQRQRIAIARAILKDPSILILDEATSALDANSERQVQEALARVMKGRTVLVIAHRLSTIIDSDLICVMNRGKVIEKGSHQDLMRMDGAYAKLFRKQQEK